MIRSILSCFLLLVFCALLSAAESNTPPTDQNSANQPASVLDQNSATQPASAPDQNSAAQMPNAGQPDEAGRPVQPAANTAPPPPTPPPVRQDFRQNVKDVYFDFNRSNLTPDDQATLQKNAEWLKAHPDVVFTIEGDADSRGSIVYNLYLSDERALAARDELKKLGVPENQIVFATGWGKLYPVCQQEDESCWSQNRRSHFAAWPPDLGTALTGETASGAGGSR